MKVLTGYKVRVVAAGVVLALGSAACGSAKTSQASQTTQATSAAPPTTVKIGYLTGDSASALFAVANQQDLWQKYNLKPDLVTFTSGPLALEALKAGDIQIAHGGVGALWPAMAGQAELLGADVFDNADALIAQPSSGVTSIAQLKGKDVAVTTGTATDILLRLALQHAGIPFSDVHEVQMAPATIVSAFVSNQVQLAGSWYPLLNTILAKIPNTVILARSTSFAPSVRFLNGFLTTRNMVSSDPGLATRVMAVLETADNWVAAHKSAAETLAAKFNGVAVSSEQLTLNNVAYLTSAEFSGDIQNGQVASWLKTLSQQFALMGIIPAVQPVSSYFASNIYLAAAKKVS